MCSAEGTNFEYNYSYLDANVELGVGLRFLSENAVPECGL